MWYVSNWCKTLMIISWETRKNQNHAIFMLCKISSSSSPWPDQSFLLSTGCPQKVDDIIFIASFGRPPLAFMVVFVHLGQFQATESHLGYLKHFFGIPSAQHVSIRANCYCIYEVGCLLWYRLVAVEIDGHQQWTNDWHTSLRMCLLHTGGGDTTIFNHLESQSFGVSIIWSLNNLSFQNEE